MLKNKIQKTLEKRELITVLRSYQHLPTKVTTSKYKQDG